MGWKIVRDHQREFCERTGVSGRWRVSPDVVAALAKKLFEEAAEFTEAHDPEELYDVRDVLQELLHVCDPYGEAEVYHAQKVAIVGLFGSHLEWNPVPERNLAIEQLTQKAGMHD